MRSFLGCAGQNFHAGVCGRRFLAARPVVGMGFALEWKDACHMELNTDTDQCNG
jgi:hypothetical protein